jgi:hypothetical protein
MEEDEKLKRQALWHKHSVKLPSGIRKTNPYAKALLQGDGAFGAKIILDKRAKKPKYGLKKTLQEAIEELETKE